MSEGDSPDELKSPPPPTPPKRFDPTYVGAMSHFYRGELGRIMVWRRRLDVTTSWAITTTSTIFTVSFSVRDVPHIIFFFNIIVVLFLLLIEARRYRFYDAFRARVRMLEAHFLVPLVMQNTGMLQGEWQKLVCEDLLLPSFKISRFEAFGRRLKRNYQFIFMIILVAWLTKIFLHADPPITSLSTFYHAMHVGKSLPSWFVATLFVGTFVSVVVIVAYINKYSAGEVGEFSEHRAMWRI
jgi:uncharacterized membrane protein